MEPPPDLPLTSTEVSVIKACFPVLPLTMAVAVAVDTVEVQDATVVETAVHPGQPLLLLALPIRVAVVAVGL